MQNILYYYIFAHILSDSSRHTFGFGMAGPKGTLALRLLICL